MSDNIPQGTAQILAGMSPAQLGEFLGGIRQDVSVVHSAPVADALAAVTESVNGLELGEHAERVGSLLQLPEDGIHAALESRHARLMASDLPDSVKEQVSAVFAEAGQKFNVNMAPFVAPVPADGTTSPAPSATPAPAAGTETPQATEQDVRVQKLEAKDAARDAIDAAEGQTPEVKAAVREAVLADVEAGKVLGADAAKRAVESQFQFATRVTESLPQRRTFGNIPSRDADQRATESEVDHPTRSRLYETAKAQPASE